MENSQSSRLAEPSRSPARPEAVESGGRGEGHTSPTSMVPASPAEDWDDEEGLTLEVSELGTIGARAGAAATNNTPALEMEPMSPAFVSDFWALLGLDSAVAEAADGSSLRTRSDLFDLESLVGRLAQQEQSEEREAGEALPRRTDPSDGVAADAVYLPAGFILPGFPASLRAVGSNLSSTNPFRIGQAGVGGRRGVLDNCGDEDWAAIASGSQPRGVLTRPLFGLRGNGFSGAEPGQLGGFLEQRGTATGANQVGGRPFPPRSLRHTSRPNFVPHPRIHRVNGFPQSSGRLFTDPTVTTTTTATTATTTTTTTTTMATTTTATTTTRVVVVDVDHRPTLGGFPVAPSGHPRRLARASIVNEEDGPFDQIPLDERRGPEPATPPRRPYFLESSPSTSTSTPGQGSSTARLPLPRFQFPPRPQAAAPLSRRAQFDRQWGLLPDAQAEGREEEGRGSLDPIITTTTPPADTNRPPMARRRPPLMDLLTGRVTRADDTPAADRHPGTAVGSYTGPTTRGSAYDPITDAYFDIVGGVEPLFGIDDDDDDITTTRRGSARTGEVAPPPAVFTSPARSGAGDETELPLGFSLVSLEEAARRQRDERHLESMERLNRQEHRRRLQDTVAGLESAATSGTPRPPRTYQPGRQPTADPITAGPSTSMARLAAPWHQRGEDVEMQNLGGLFQQVGELQPPVPSPAAFGSPSDQAFLA